MSAVSRRYAKAIFALATEAQQIEATGNQLAGTARLLSDPALYQVVASPLLKEASRHKIVQGIEQQLALSPLVAKFLRLLADQQRLDQIPAIARQYQQLEDNALGRLRMVIRAAAPLQDTDRDAIVDAFARATGKTVVARVDVDPALIGGVVVEAQGKVYDGSVRTQLARLTRQIAGARAH